VLQKVADAHAKRQRTPAPRQDAPPRPIPLYGTLKDTRSTPATGRHRRADASSQPAAAPLRQGAPPGTASRR